jgi:hypothetical protein
MCNFEDIVKLEAIIFGSLCFIFVCYSRSLKHLMASRCVEINFCGLNCKRTPLSDEMAHQVVVEPEHIRLDV